MSPCFRCFELIAYPRHGPRCLSSRLQLAENLIFLCNALFRDRLPIIVQVQSDRNSSGNPTTLPSVRSALRTISVLPNHMSFTPAPDAIGFSFGKSTGDKFGFHGRHAAVAPIPLTFK
jgi:hypothetical protein